MKQQSNRPPYQQRVFRLVSIDVLQRAIGALSNAPLDQERPLEVIIREHQTKRSDQQNNLYWTLLSEIAQHHIHGRTYSAEVLHEYLKRELLPEDGPLLDPEEVRDGYCKWSYDPAGERILIGSTTMLTVKGFGNYITAVEHFGASLGVEFSERKM